MAPNGESMINLKMGLTERKGDSIYNHYFKLANHIHYKVLCIPTHSKTPTTCKDHNLELEATPSPVLAKIQSPTSFAKTSLLSGKSACN